MRKIFPIISIFLSIVFTAVFLLSVKAQAQGIPDHDNPSLNTSSGTNEAHVVVQMKQGDNLVRKIAFDEESISGLQALELTGLDVITQDFGWGIAVCSINGVGCPADNCFCSSSFWNYAQWDSTSSAWVDPGVGATDTSVYSGSIEGWRWGLWDQGSLLPAPQMLSAAYGTEWLARQQNAVTGGYGSSPEGSMSASTESLLSIGANDYLATKWSRYPYSKPLHSYVWGRSSAYVDQPAEAGKFATGFVAAQGVCWSPIAHYPMDFYDPDSGQYSEHSGFQVWGIFGTLALSETVPQKAVDYLKSQVFPDGGWEWNKGLNLGTDTNTTALALQALIASGEPPTSTFILNGLDFLKSAQNTDGGFTYYADPSNPYYMPDSDTNSTAYAVQAIYAAGQDPITGTWIISGTNPIEFIMSMQLDGGSFEWIAGQGINLLASQQAIPALLGESLPYRVMQMEQCPGAFLNILQRDPTYKP
jgi:hypothetical protein